MVRSIFSNWLGLMVLGVTSVILTPILIHGLGDYYYGVWILVASAVDYYGMLDLGIRPALFRMVAWSKGADDPTAMHETLLSALAFTVGVGFCLLALTLILIPVLPGFFRLSGPARQIFPWLMILLGLNVAAAFPARMLGAYLNSLGRFDLYNMTAVFSTTLRAGFVVVALRLGYGIRAVAGITLATTMFSLLLNAWAVFRSDRTLPLDWRLARWSRLRGLFQYGFFIFVYNVGDQLRFYTDSIVIARVLGAAFITPFNVAARLMEYFKQIITGVGGPLMGQMAELDGCSRHRELQEYFLRSNRVSALLSVFIGSILVFDGRLLLNLWVGERFLSSYTLLVVLTAGYMVALAQQPCGIVIAVRDRLGPAALWTIGEGIANLALSIYWARRYGLFGVALGTTVPMLIGSTLFLPWYALRVLGLSAGDYFRQALAQPIAVGIIFSYLCWFAAGAQIGRTFLYLLWTVAWQTICFGLLAAIVGLRSFERKALFKHGKVSLGFVRAT